MSGEHRKLIECALPLAEIGDACAREKDVHTGLPPNLHAWWSRKPLAAARAILVASILDDPGDGESASAERQRLLALVAASAETDLLEDETKLTELRKTLREAAGHLPEFWDPFCGGGSIPLEAARLGLQTTASDLNPVATLMTKAMLEVVPKAAACGGIDDLARVAS
jgi:putative DNA methylase